MDKHSGIPAPGLNPEDFEVVSDRARLGVTSVAGGSQSESRPLSVWFVMQCPEEGIAFSGVSYGSGFMRGKSRAFTPILQKLTPRDTAGVAHWCDDGTLGIDLLPTTDRIAPSESIEKVLSAPMAHVSNEPGQNGLHDVFLRAREVTQRTSPGALPFWCSSTEITAGCTTNRSRSC